MTMQETLDKFFERFDKNNNYNTEKKRAKFLEDQWGLFISWIKEYE